jgi:hypothetical protein
MNDHHRCKIEEHNRLIFDGEKEAEEKETTRKNSRCPKEGEKCTEDPKRLRT